VIGASGSGKSTFLDAFIHASHAQGVENVAEQPAQIDTASNKANTVKRRSVVKALREKEIKSKD